MQRYARVLFAVLLTLGVCWLALARAGDDKDKINADVQKLADAVNKPAPLKNLAADLVSKYELDAVAGTFQPREKGGIGVGAKPGAETPDGIELKLLELDKKPPNAGQLAAQGPDLQRMAEVARGIAEAMPDYGKKYAKGPVAAKLWEGFAADMKKESDDLIAAIKGNDLDGAQKAAHGLTKCCTDCHAKFR